MNKTYKIVFNKIRKAMMVVDEATRSTQRKGAKGAVTVAALSTILCAVSGQALAAIPLTQIVDLQGYQYNGDYSTTLPGYADSGYGFNGRIDGTYINNSINIRRVETKFTWQGNESEPWHIAKGDLYRLLPTEEQRSEFFKNKSSVSPYVKAISDYVNNNRLKLGYISIYTVTMPTDVSGLAKKYIADGNYLYSIGKNSVTSAVELQKIPYDVELKGAQVGQVDLGQYRKFYGTNTVITGGDITLETGSSFALNNPLTYLVASTTSSTYAPDGITPLDKDVDYNKTKIHALTAWGGASFTGNYGTYEIGSINASDKAVITIASDLFKGTEGTYSSIGSTTLNTGAKLTAGNVAVGSDSSHATVTVKKDAVADLKIGGNSYIGTLTIENNGLFKANLDTSSVEKAGSNGAYNGSDYTYTYTKSAVSLGTSDKTLSIDAINATAVDVAETAETASIQLGTTTPSATSTTKTLKTILREVTLGKNRYLLAKNTTFGDKSNIRLSTVTIDVGATLDVDNGGIDGSRIGTLNVRTDSTGTGTFKVTGNGVLAIDAINTGTGTADNHVAISITNGTIGSVNLGEYSTLVVEKGSIGRFNQKERGPYDPMLTEKKADIILGAGSQYTIKNYDTSSTASVKLGTLEIKVNSDKTATGKLSLPDTAVLTSIDTIKTGNGSSTTFVDLNLKVSETLGVLNLGDYTKLTVENNTTKSSKITGNVSLGANAELTATNYALTGSKTVTLGTNSTFTLDGGSNTSSLSSLTFSEGSTFDFLSGTLNVSAFKSTSSATKVGTLKIGTDTKTANLTVGDTSSLLSFEVGKTSSFTATAIKQAEIGSITTADGASGTGNHASIALTDTTGESSKITGAVTLGKYTTFTATNTVVDNANVTVGAGATFKELATASATNINKLTVKADSSAAGSFVVDYISKNANHKEVNIGEIVAENGTSATNCAYISIYYETHDKNDVLSTALEKSTIGTVTLGNYATLKAVSAKFAGENDSAVAVTLKDNASVLLDNYYPYKTAEGRQGMYFVERESNISKLTVGKGGSFTSNAFVKVANIESSGKVEFKSADTDKRFTALIGDVTLHDGGTLTVAKAYLGTGKDSSGNVTGKVNINLEAGSTYTITELLNKPKIGTLTIGVDATNNKIGTLVNNSGYAAFESIDKIETGNGKLSGTHAILDVTGVETLGSLVLGNYTEFTAAAKVIKTGSDGIQIGESVVLTLSPNGSSTSSIVSGSSLSTTKLELKGYDPQFTAKYYDTVSLGAVSTDTHDDTKTNGGRLIAVSNTNNLTVDSITLNGYSYFTATDGIVAGTIGSITTNGEKEAIIKIAKAENSSGTLAITGNINLSNGGKLEANRVTLSSNSISVAEKATLNLSNSQGTVGAIENAGTIGLGASGNTSTLSVTGGINSVAKNEVGTINSLNSLKVAGDLYLNTLNVTGEFLSGMDEASNSVNAATNATVRIATLNLTGTTAAKFEGADTEIDTLNGSAADSNTAFFTEASSTASRVAKIGKVNSSGSITVGKAVETNPRKGSLSITDTASVSKFETLTLNSESTFSAEGVSLDITSLDLNNTSKATVGSASTASTIDNVTIEEGATFDITEGTVNVQTINNNATTPTGTVKVNAATNTATLNVTGALNAGKLDVGEKGTVTATTNAKVSEIVSSGTITFRDSGTSAALIGDVTLTGSASLTVANAKFGKVDSTGALSEKVSINLGANTTYTVTALVNNKPVIDTLTIGVDTETNKVATLTLPTGTLFKSVDEVVTGDGDKETYANLDLKGVETLGALQLGDYTKLQANANRISTEREVGIKLGAGVELTLSLATATGSIISTPKLVLSQDSAKFTANNYETVSLGAVSTVAAKEGVTPNGATFVVSNANSLSATSITLDEKSSFTAETGITQFAVDSITTAAGTSDQHARIVLKDADGADSSSSRLGSVNLGDYSELTLDKACIAGASNNIKPDIMLGVGSKFTIKNLKNTPTIGTLDVKVDTEKAGRGELVLDSGVKFGSIDKIVTGNGDSTTHATLSFGEVETLGALVLGDYTEFTSKVKNLSTELEDGIQLGSHVVLDLTPAEEGSTPATSGSIATTKLVLSQDASSFTASNYASVSLGNVTVKEVSGSTKKATLVVKDTDKLTAKAVNIGKSTFTVNDDVKQIVIDSITSVAGSASDHALINLKDADNDASTVSVVGGINLGDYTEFTAENVYLADTKTGNAVDVKLGNSSKFTLEGNAATSKIATLDLGVSSQFTLKDATLEVDTLTGSGNVEVGSATAGTSAASHGYMYVNTLSMNGGAIYVDPTYGETSVFTVENFGTGNTLNTDITAGPGALVTIGLGTTTEARATVSRNIANSSSMNVNAASKGGAIGSSSSLIYVAKAMTLGETGSLTADPTAKAASGVAKTVSAKNGGVILIDQGKVGVDNVVFSGATSITVDDKSDGKAISAIAVVDIVDDKNIPLSDVAGATVIGNNFPVYTDNPFVTATLNRDTATIELEATATSDGATSVAATGAQSMANRIDSVLSKTVSDRFTQVRDITKGKNLWVSVTGERYKQDHLTEGLTIKANMGYGTLGLDLYPTENSLVGLAFQYSFGKVKSNYYSINNKIKAYSATLYGGYTFDSTGIELLGELAYTQAKNDFTNSYYDGLNQKFDTKTFAAGLTVQKKFEVGAFDITPSVGVRISKIKTDTMKASYVDIPINSLTLVAVPVSLRLTAKPIEMQNGWSFSPKFKVSVTPTFGDKKVNVYGFETKVIDTNPMQGSVGISFTKGNFTTDVEANFGAGRLGTTSLGGKIGVNYRF